MNRNGNDKAYIGLLLEKYMAGDTSNGEEAILRQYFNTAGKAIPDEWHMYKALFRYEKEEMETSAAVKPATRNGKTVASRIRMTAVLSAAASVAVLICILLTMPDNGKDYAMIEGKKYTNRKVIIREAEEALYIVSADEDDIFGTLGEIQ